MQSSQDYDIRKDYKLKKCKTDRTRIKCTRFGYHSMELLYKITEIFRKEVEKEAEQLRKNYM